MRIVIVGAGKLGYSIAELLSGEQNDVVVIDRDESRLEAAKNTLDVLTIAANGASPITMNDPDVRGSDILIAVTAQDEVNMMACILAKKLGIRHTAARIRDTEFLTGAKEYGVTRHDWGGGGYVPSASGSGGSSEPGEKEQDKLEANKPGNSNTDKHRRL